MAGNNPIASLLTAPSANGGLAQTTVETAFTQAAHPTLSAVTYIPGASRCDKRAIRIVASGTVTGGTTVNATIALYLQSATTLTSGNKIATTGAVAVNSAAGNWNLVVDAVIDSTSGKIMGCFQGAINNAAVARIALSNATAQDPTGADLPIMASSTFSASNAGNIATLDQLDIEYL